MGKGKGNPEYWVARSSPGALCSRLTVFRGNWHRRRFALLQQNCHLIPVLFVVLAILAKGVCDYGNRQS